MTNTNGSVAKSIQSGIVIGCFMSAALMALVFMTGNTFGTRCAKVAKGNAVEKEMCMMAIRGSKEEFRSYLKELQDRNAQDRNSNKFSVKLGGH